MNLLFYSLAVMKYTLVFFFVFINFISFDQDEGDMRLPSIEMLANDHDVQHFIELEFESKYTVFNSQGELITSGIGQFIDYTEYEPGTYFVHYGNKTINFTRE